MRAVRERKFGGLVERRHSEAQDREVWTYKCKEDRDYRNHILFSWGHRPRMYSRTFVWRCNKHDNEVEGASELTLQVAIERDVYIAGFH